MISFLALSQAVLLITVSSALPKFMRAVTSHCTA